MAKKPNKPNLPEETLARARRELYGTAEPLPKEKTRPDAPVLSRPSVPRRVVASAVDLREQYAYVVSDLQNMGILAAILMVLLVAMSFFI